MLQRMNKISKGWVSSIFMGLLAISFGVFFNIKDIQLFGTDDTVATVGTARINTADYRRTYDQAVQQMSQQGVTAEMARAMGYPQRVLQDMIDQAALDNLGNQLNVTVSDAQVDAVIRQDQNFRGADGNFDYNGFLQRIGSIKLTEGQYKNLMRQAILSRQLELSMDSSFALPLSYSRALYDYLGEVRAADYVVVTPSALSPIADPGDTVLADYLKKNIDRFSTPEYRTLSYAAITPDDVKAQIQVPEAQVEQEYQARKASYVTPEKRDIEQIVYPDEAAAKTARAKITKGQTFAAAAAERGMKPSDLSLGTLVAGDIKDDRGAAAFALKQNEVSQPVKGPFGWTLLHATKIVPGSVKDEATAKKELRDAIANAMAGAKIDEITNAYQDAHASGSDVMTAGKKAGMTSGKVAALDSKGKTPDGLMSAAPIDSEFLDQVFKADVGDDVDPFKTTSGGAYAIKVEGVVPPKPRPLSEVRKEVLAAWTADERTSRLKAKADELAAQAKKENSLAGVASAIHASVQKTAGLKRSSTSDTFSAVLLGQLFTAPRDGVVVGPQAKGDGIVVARLTGISHPSTANDSKELTAARQQLSQQAAADFTGMLSKAEQSKLKITSNPKLVDQTVGEGQ